MTFPIKKSFVLIQAHRHIWVSFAQIPAEPRPHQAPTITTLYHRDPDLDWFLSPPARLGPRVKGASLRLRPLSPLPNPSCHSWRLLATVPFGAL